MSNNKKMDITYSIFKQKLTYKKYKQYFNILKEMLHYSKNLFNEALYILRQNFFDNQNKEKKDRKYISYYDLYNMLKNSNNYKYIQAACAQQILKIVYETFKSFVALKKKKIKCNMPRYLDKDGYFQLIDSEDDKRINKINNKLYYTIPMSYQFLKEHDLMKINDRIKIQIFHILENKKIRQIRITPKYKAKYIEIHYYFEKEKDQIDPLAQVKENNNFNILSIDLGINNLTTCTIYKPYEKLKNKFRAFIIDGKKLKSYNQWYNKRIKFLKKKLNEDKNKNNQIHYSKQMYNITYKRNNRIYDYINKTCNYIVKYCLQNDIHIIILGYNQGMKQNIDLGKKSNQKITNIPFYKLKEQLIYRCEEKNIKLIMQEESYTSKANFINNDYIFTYDKNALRTIKNKVELKKIIFSGIRRKGLYKTNNNIKINADVNGSLNIMRKALLNKEISNIISNVVNEEHLICGEQIIDKKILSRLKEDVKKILDIRGGLVTPIRIKLV